MKVMAIVIENDDCSESSFTKKCRLKPCSHRTSGAWQLVPPRPQMMKPWTVSALGVENVFKTGTWPEFHKANPCKEIVSAHFLDRCQYGSFQVCLDSLIWWAFNTSTTKLQAFMFRASSTIFAKFQISLWEETLHEAWDWDWMYRSCLFQAYCCSTQPFGRIVSSSILPSDPSFEMRRSDTPRAEPLRKNGLPKHLG